MRACAKGESGVEVNDDRACVVDAVIGRADPEALTEAHRAQILEPFAFPGAIFQGLGVVRRQFREAELVLEGRPEDVHVGLGCKKARDTRAGPEWCLARARFEHRVVAGVGECYGAGAEPQEGVFDFVGIQRVEFHDEL